jgi:TPR repeat protein
MDIGAADGAEINAADGAEAYFRLGLMYSAGRDCPVDYVTAHKWFNVALARGFKPAAELRAELAMQMSGDEIAEALREARMFLTRH